MSARYRSPSLSTSVGATELIQKSVASSVTNRSEPTIVRSVKVGGVPAVAVLVRAVGSIRARAAMTASDRAKSRMGDVLPARGRTRAVAGWALDSPSRGWAYVPPADLVSNLERSSGPQCRSGRPLSDGVEGPSAEGPIG